MRSSLIRRVLCRGGVTAVLLAGFVPSAAAFDGWSVQPSPNPGVYGNMLMGVSARSATHVWAVVGRKATATSNDTLAARWNGSSWKRGPDAEPRRVRLRQLPVVEQHVGRRLGLFEDDVWAVGSDCAYPTGTLIEHWNGSAWSIVPSAAGPRLGGDDGWSMLSGVVAISPSNAGP